MKISYDAEVDTLSIIFRETTVTTEHLAAGIAVDYDSEGQLAGIEILDAMQKFGGPETLHQVIIQQVGLQPRQCRKLGVAHDRVRVSISAHSRWDQHNQSFS